MSQLTPATDLPTDLYPMTPTPTPPSANPSVNRKRLLGISAAALLLTGGGILIANGGGGEPGPTPENPVDDPAPEANAAVSLPEDIDVAGKVTDTMSFDQAFAAARDEVGMGGVFSWQGRWYNTLHKEEWDSLSLDQRQEFLEHIMQEKLPVKSSHQTQAQSVTTEAQPTETEPTLVEGHLNGQRVMGLDFDHDGVIDTVVLEGNDGNVYRVVDAQGDDGLDTIFRYDAFTDQLMAVERLDHSIVLSVDQFNQGLEESMSKEIVDSILETDTIESPATSTSDVPSESDTTDDNHASDDDEFDAADDAADDTYINDGNVDDMDNHRA